MCHSARPAALHRACADSQQRSPGNSLQVCWVARIDAVNGCRVSLAAGRVVRAIGIQEGVHGRLRLLASRLHCIAQLVAGRSGVLADQQREGLQAAYASLRQMCSIQLVKHTQQLQATLGPD